MLKRLLIALAFILVAMTPRFTQGGACRTGANCATFATSCISTATACTQTCLTCQGASALTININTQTCAGTTCNANCSAGSTLVGSSTTSLSSGCSGTRDIVICQSWVDCNATAIASRCDHASISAGMSITPGNLVYTNAPAGTYQYEFIADDYTNLTDSCDSNSNCPNACSESCTGGALGNCDVLALAGGCCITLT